MPIGLRLSFTSSLYLIDRYYTIPLLCSVYIVFADCHYMNLRLKYAGHSYEIWFYSNVDSVDNVLSVFL